VANKNTSEPGNSSNRSRTRATAKPAAQRRPATTASSSRASSSRVQSSSNSATQIDTATDMQAASADQVNPAYDEIAEAAYHRFLSRGGQDGGDVDDWIEAERDLRERRSR